MSYDVFLSHNSQDKAAVEQIGRLLTQTYGLTCWLDKWNLVPGEPWQETLEQALDQCQTVAVFVGQGAISPWENEEMRSALETRVHDKRRRVIPVLLPGAPSREDLKLPRFISRLTWVDYRNGLNDKDALYRLSCGIQGIKPGDQGEGHIAGGTSGLWRWRLYLRKIFRKLLLVLILAALMLILLIRNFHFPLPNDCGDALSTSSAYIYRAANQRDDGRYDCAIHDAMSGLRLDPNANQEQKLYYLLASIYIVKGDPGTGLKYADLGLAGSGSDTAVIANLHLTKAIMYCQMKQNPDAIQEFDVYFDLNPTPGDSMSFEAMKIRNDLELGYNKSEDCWTSLGTELMP